MFLGSLLGSASRVTTHTPLVGAEIRLDPHTTLALDIDPHCEHAVLLDSGAVLVNNDALEADHLGYVPTGTHQISITTGDAGARLVLIGGEPLGEEIVMWWNFIGRSHEDVETYRQRWQSEIGQSGGDEAPQQPWYGLPSGDPESPLPAPPLPGVRIRPRS